MCWISGRKMTNMYVKKTLDEQGRGLEEDRKECIETYGAGVQVERTYPINDSSRNLTCPPYWDQIICWSETTAGKLAIEPCPSYFTGFIPSNNASRQCMENGVWFINKTTNTSWSNYTECYKDPIATIHIDFDKPQIPLILEKYTPVVKLISELGYIISLSSLIIAFSIMLFIRKLHCARNILHMHLFASFIMRAVLFLVIKITFIDGTALSSDFDYHNGSLYFHTHVQTNNWGCKLMTSLKHYFLTANYSWILMEGLYLHNLIFRALFVDSSNSIKWYIILGWGLPLIVVPIWVASRLLIADTFCWTNEDNTISFLILAVPTMVSILINLVLFLRISMVLYSKLRSPINEDSRRYQKWAKSTLVLVPLFGVHYAISLCVYSWIKTNNVVHLVWLLCDQLFGSFQGCFVAVLYCFLNGEVRSEIQPHLYCLLTYLATNRCSKHIFPYRKKFLRSVVGRSSVCTTMSCSSLYTNGVLHRNSKTRLDSLPKTKPPGDIKDHVCHNGTKTSNHRRCSQSELHRHSQSFLAAPTAETALSRSEPEINEETYRMMVQNNF